MDNLIEILKSFNRKERFFLVGMALGNKDFKLCNEFKRCVTKVLDLDIPENAFVAMDYHLDWVSASLFIWGNDAQTVFENDGTIKATQEDIDLLVAFQEYGKYHLVMLEAKGEMSWTNRQLRSKILRLKEIFGNDGTRYANVVPHFALVSPNQPRKLRIYDWPSWMKPNNRLCWIELQLPGNRRKVTRCDAGGNANREGAYWKIEI